MRLSYQTYFGLTRQKYNFNDYGNYFLYNLFNILFINNISDNKRLQSITNVCCRH